MCEVTTRGRPCCTSGHKGLGARAPESAAAASFTSTFHAGTVTLAAWLYAVGPAQEPRGILGANLSRDAPDDLAISRAFISSHTIAPILANLRITAPTRRIAAEIAALVARGLPPTAFAREVPMETMREETNGIEDGKQARGKLAPVRSDECIDPHRLRRRR